jgi:hypothetical protein
MTHTIIVPTAIRDACNLAAHQLGIDPAGTLDTLSVPLVPAAGPDDAEPTHWAAHGTIPQAAREYLADNLDQFPGALWWRWDAAGLLVASHDSEDLGQPWDWETSLSAAALKRQRLPLFP